MVRDSSFSRTGPAPGGNIATEVRSPLFGLVGSNSNV
jgi:hypothetical protein